MSNPQAKERIKLKFATIRQAFSGITMGANLVALLLLWMVCATTYLPPSHYSFITVAGLAFPIVLLLNIVFLFLWIFVNWRRLWVPILGMGLVWSFIMDYHPINLGSPKGKADLKVVTWNVLAFYRVKGKESQFEKKIESWNADLLVFQEEYGGKEVEHVDSFMSGLGYAKASDNGRAVYSRFPILRSWSPQAPTANANGFFVVDVLMNGDTATIVNCHLESNLITKQDRADGREAMNNHINRKTVKKARTLWGKLARSARLRAEQADCLARLLDSLPPKRPVIVCGDFNDTPISYAYRQISKRLQCAYRNAGNGVGVSFNERFFYFRIDHFFHSDYWETHSVVIEPHSPFSDHNPQIVTLRRGEKR